MLCHSTAMTMMSGKNWDKPSVIYRHSRGSYFIAHFIALYRSGNDLGEAPILDWEILAQILRHVRQSARLIINDERLRTMEEVQPFARAIRGHPSITSFDDSGKFPYESLDTLYSALATLPALESVSFGASEVRQACESTLANPGSLTELLRVPSLRTVRFHRFSFTPALFQATADALMEGTAIIKLDFSECSFSAEECATIMGNGPSKNTSVISISVVKCNNARALFDALAVTLPSNSTLQHLKLGQHDPGCLSPLFSALGQNTGLEALKVDCCDSINESLCTAMKYGLEMNETLESLKSINVPLLDGSAALGCRAFSFLRTNKTLKSLTIDLTTGTTRSCVSAFLRHIAVMLQENSSLESLSFRDVHGTIEAKEFFDFVTVLQHNTTLNMLSLYHTSGSLRLTGDEDKQMASLLKKNHALELLPNIEEAGDVRAILQLNKAGRRYLIQDGSSVSKGVAVLSAVSNDINCVFLLRLENPRLCDRRAVEAASDITDKGRSTSPVSHIGKREHGWAQNEGMESRRRLT